MARLIDADALRVDLNDELGFQTPMFTAEQNKWIDYGLEVAIKDLKYQPTVDAVPVVHGRWIPTYHTYYNRDGEHQIADEWHCSQCEIYSKDEWHYCPNCGAKMDLEVE